MPSTCSHALSLLMLLGSGALFGQDVIELRYQCPAPIIQEQKSFLSGLSELDEKARVSFSGHRLKVRLSTNADAERLGPLLDRCGLGQCVRDQRKNLNSGEFVGGWQQGTLGSGTDGRNVVIITR